MEIHSIIHHASYLDGSRQSYCTSITGIDDTDFSSDDCLTLYSRMTSQLLYMEAAPCSLSNHPVCTSICGVGACNAIVCGTRHEKAKDSLSDQPQSLRPLSQEVAQPLADTVTIFHLKASLIKERNADPSSTSRSP